MMFGKITVDLYEKLKSNGFQGSHFLKFAFAFQISKEATEEEVEEGRQSKKETIKKSSSTSIVSCSTCEHILTIHEDSKDHNCESCGKLFCDSEKLKNHIHTVHDNEGIKMTGTQSLRLTKFKYEICRKEITGKHNFKVHMENVYEEIKQFKCEDCGKLFTRSTSLKSHISGVHEKIKKFNCDQCDKVFSKGYNLKVHIKTVHEKEKKFICQICNKGFGKLQHLETHSVMHKK